MSAFAEGTMVKSVGPDVYFIDGGQRRLIPNPGTARALGLSLDAIREIPIAELNAIPLGAPLPKLDSNVRAICASRWLFWRGPTYLLDGGRRRATPDEETFRALTFGQVSPVVVSNSVVMAIPLGEPYASCRRALREAPQVAHIIRSVGLGVAGAVGAALAARAVERMFAATGTRLGGSSGSGFGDDYDWLATAAGEAAPADFEGLDEMHTVIGSALKDARKRKPGPLQQAEDGGADFDSDDDGSDDSDDS
jgi:hypothetical protein